MRFLLLVFLICSVSSKIVAEESPEIEAVERDEPENKEKWVTPLKERYNLTDEQISLMQSQNITYPQMAIAAQIAQKSEKPLEEVLKMRTEQKMGWGRIAKELDISPSELHRGLRGKSSEHRSEMQNLRKAQRKEKQILRKENRKERNDLRKEQRKQAKEAHKK